MPLITRGDLLRFAPQATPTIVGAVVNKADAVFPKWGITTPRRLWMFMAQADVESAHFSKLFESMNYSDHGLLSTFPTHFTAATAKKYGRTADHPADQRMIANIAYGDRMGNRGSNTDDGWLCRGTGLMQTTGLSNFSRLAKALGLSVDETRAMLTADDGLLECAVATFVAWGCLPAADAGDVLTCTKLINGGTNGLADRQAAYARAQKIWPTLPTIAAQPSPQVTAPIAASVTTIVPRFPPDPAPTSPHITGVVPVAPARQTWGEWFAATFFRRSA